MSYTVSTSDLDRHAQEELEQCEAIIQRFVQTEAGCIPNRPFVMDRFIEAKAVQRKLNPGSAKDLAIVARDVANVIKERCCHKMTRSGRVYLDLDEATPENIGWLSEHPHIAFGALTDADRGLCEFLGSPDVAVIAVYFDPKLAKRRYQIDRYTGEKQAIPDQFDPNGYVQIVATFDSLVEADEAKDELQQAIRTWVAVRKSAYEYDPVEDTLGQWEPEHHGADTL